MSRPRKCRRVCCLPKYSEFAPIDNPDAFNNPIILTVDEYETIRLIDKEGFSQEECGNYMNVARTTVQQIYTGARNKIACSLVSGHAILIRGGDYHLCEGNEQYCKCGGCLKHRMRNEMLKKEEKEKNENNDSSK